MEGGSHFCSESQLCKKFGWMMPKKILATVKSIASKMKWGPNLACIAPTELCRVVYKFLFEYNL